MKIIKKTLNVEQYIRYIKELFFHFKYPKTNKTVKIPGMSLRLKKVCPVCNTYPISEILMYWLIKWHLCVYRGVKVWSFSYLLVSVNQVSLTYKSYCLKIEQKNLYGYSILPLMMQ